MDSLTESGTAVAPPDIGMPAIQESWIARASEALETATSMDVICEADQAAAAAELALVKSLWDSFEKMREEAKRPFLDRGRQVDSLFKTVLEPLSEAEAEWKRKIGEFRRKQTELAQRLRVEAERRRAEEQARADAEARAAAEAADKAREAAENAKSDAARDQAQQAAQEAAAKAAEAEARTLEVAVAPVAAPAGPAKVAGMTERVKYTGRGVNLRELVHAAAKDDALLGYLEFNERAINLAAQGLGAQFRVPGCVAEQKTVISQRRSSGFSTFSAIVTAFIVAITIVVAWPVYLAISTPRSSVFKVEHNDSSVIVIEMQCVDGRLYWNSGTRLSPVLSSGQHASCANDANGGQK